MNTISFPRAASSPVVRPRPLNWIMRVDAAYRERCALRAKSAAQLQDLGLSRKDVNDMRIADVLRRACQS